MGLPLEGIYSPMILPWAMGENWLKATKSGLEDKAASHSRTKGRQMPHREPAKNFPEIVKKNRLDVRIS